MPEFDFGHFHILGELGRGGMALVYKAVDTRTDETIALKVLYPHLMSDANTIKRFQREARVAARLKHKYIVPVTDFGEHEDQIYIAMRYMAGDSLSDLFAEPRAVKMQGIVRILGEVASALDYAHGQGVIHRDLKLQNILLDEKRHAYLSDFGIARLVDGTRLTATGQIAGTPMYMSPEQIRGKTVDFRSDIYSFSVMAYLMLTGYYPFTGEDSLSIIHKHVKEFPPIPTEVNSDLPEAVDAVLLRGLMKDPKDRYDTTIAMVKALHQAVSSSKLHTTSTRIDIRARNPVDSVEMDAVSAGSDRRIQSATGGAVANVVTSQSQSQSMLQSDLSSAVITGQQTMQSNGSRMGIFGLVFGTIAVAAIAIPLIVLLLQNNAGDSNRGEFVSTLARREIEIELTETALVHESSEIEDEEATNQTDDNAENSSLKDTAEPPPPTLSATATEDEGDFAEANGVVLASNGAIMKTGPNGEFLATISVGAYVQIVGRTGLGDYLYVITANDGAGYIQQSEIDTDFDFCSLDPTYLRPLPSGNSRPEGPPPEKICEPPGPPNP